MVKHLANSHPDKPWRTEIPIRARVVKYHNNIMKRVVDESLRLEKHGGLANSKGEWGRGGGLVRQHTARTN